MTDYLKEHPGGPSVIIDNAGEDATDGFESTGHSPEAHTTLATHKIGQVAYDATKRVRSDSSGISFFQVLLFLIILVGAIIIGNEEYKIEFIKLFE